MKGVIQLFAFSLLVTGLLHSCKTQKAQVFTPEQVPAIKTYAVSYDHHNQKVLKGLIPRPDIETDTAFGWFKKNMQYGSADPNAIKTFKEKAGSFEVVVFCGTWCEDSQNLLPQFYRLVDKSGFPDSAITLIGLDRNKETLYNLHKVFNVKNVPTFIIMKNGKEAGRMVEYGKYGTADTELAEIVSSAP